MSYVSLFSIPIGLLSTILKIYKSFFSIVAFLKKKKLKKMQYIYLVYRMIFIFLGMVEKEMFIMTSIHLDMRISSENMRNSLAFNFAKQICSKVPNFI